MMKHVAVVTPYYMEEYTVLRRCLNSVRDQRLSGNTIVDHIVVGDGVDRLEADSDIGLRHLRLDQAHGDYGNVARGVGALLAAGEGYDAICFLDADNWYEPNHVEECLRVANPNVDVVFARRRFCRPDGSDMKVADEAGHVDTSCYFFLPGSYAALAYWALMPKPMTCIGDRAFLQLLKSTPGLVFTHTCMVTVNYLCMWESYYKALGETPPPGAKPNVDGRAFEQWRAGLNGRELEIACRLAGGRLK